MVDLHFVDGHMERVPLPGATLRYGCCNALNKIGAMLWALWLVFGPDEHIMRKVLGLVRGVTTDYGTEMKTIECQDFLAAFLASTRGEPVHVLQSLVNPHGRLFPSALRLGGWSHEWGTS